MYYVLNSNNEPVKTDVISWTLQFDKMDRKVAHTDVGDTRISTVFLGLDHGYNSSKPILFETMIFSPNKDYDEWMERYCTWEEAERGHAFAVACVKSKTPLNNRKILKIKI